MRRLETHYRVSRSHPSPEQLRRDLDQSVARDLETVLGPALEGLLDDPDHRLRDAVVRALGACGDARARSALEAYHARTPHARHRRLVEASLRQLLAG